jgi:hypothetical protein
VPLLVTGYLGGTLTPGGRDQTPLLEFIDERLQFTAHGLKPVQNLLVISHRRCYPSIGSARICIRLCSIEDWISGRRMSDVRLGLDRIVEWATGRGEIIDGVEHSR